MYSLVKDIERNLQEQHHGFLDGIMNCWSIDLHVHKQVQDTHSTVYGSQSGRRQSTGFDIKGIITGDEFEPSTSVLSGSFNGGYMFTTAESVNTGDHIGVDADGEETRLFVVTDKESIGSTSEVFYRYKLAAKGTRPEES